jgi:hypothetical protein
MTRSRERVLSNLTEHPTFKVAEASSLAVYPSLRGLPAAFTAWKHLPADRRKLADMESKASFRLRRQRLPVSNHLPLPRSDGLAGRCLYLVLATKKPSRQMAGLEDKLNRPATTMQSGSKIHKHYPHFYKYFFYCLF